MKLRIHIETDVFHEGTARTEKAAIEQARVAAAREGVNMHMHAYDEDEDTWLRYVGLVRPSGEFIAGDILNPPANA